MPPCGSTGTRAAAQALTTAATSSVDAGRTTASTGPRNRRDQSSPYAAVTSGSVSTCASPTAATSAARSAGSSACGCWVPPDAWGWSLAAASGAAACGTLRFGVRRAGHDVHPAAASRIRRIGSHHRKGAVLPLRTEASLRGRFLSSKPVRRRPRTVVPQGGCGSGRGMTPGRTIHAPQGRFQP